MCINYTDMWLSCVQNTSETDNNAGRKKTEQLMYILYESKV